jgi:hypothetical protein
MKAKGGFHHDSGLHRLRHTFLTEMGILTDPFTLQRIAGHNKIQTTLRYVHPTKQAVECAFRNFFAKGQMRVLVNEIVLSSSQLASLLAGDVVLLSVPAGTSELRLKSTQKPTSTADLSKMKILHGPDNKEHDKALAEWTAV